MRHEEVKGQCHLFSIHTGVNYSTGVSSRPIYLKANTSIGIAILTQKFITYIRLNFSGSCYNVESKLEEDTTNEL